MEFLQRMKKREYVEMGLKTAIGVILGIIVIFLMEAMIYSIYIKAINNPENGHQGSDSKAVFYVIDNKNNTYDVYVHHTDTGHWALHFNNITADSYFEKLIENNGELVNYDKTLYKITDSKGTTYESTNERSAFQAVKSAYYNKDHKNVTFTVYTKEDATSEYTVKSENVSYEKVVELFSEKGLLTKGKKVIYRTPNCFDIYVNGVHYTVMAIFEAVIVGVFVWRFTLISKEYKKLEKRYKKTGKVF